MAEAKKVLGLITAVTVNMDRLRQSIGALRDLLDRWKDSSGTCINLIAQLTALKSNLGEMHDYLNYAINDMHPQLLSDLDVLMTSCGLLVRHVDALVQRLRQPDHDDVDWANKIKLTIGGRSMGKLKDVAKRQADAVNLLLAACKCHTTAQRKILLHKSRQIRKEDTSSLTVMARSSRWNGRCITTLTQLSRMIHWFRVIFYIKLFKRGPDEEVTEQDYLDAAAAMRSEAIDRALEEDATTLRRETKLVLMGQPSGGKELIMRQMKVLYADGYPREERIGYRYAMRSTIRLLIHSIIDLIKDTGINLTPELNNSFAVLLDEVETIDDHQHITHSAVEAVHRIWSSEAFSDIYVKNFEIDFPQYAPYFAHAMARIAEEEYVPSEADIIRLNQSIGGGGVKELRFNWDELDIRLFNIGGFIPTQFRKRWFHQLEGATALIYVIDISIYDRPYLGQPTESQLLDEFATFESWANSPKFSGSSVILLLNNFTRFREKLPHSPLATFFSDYVPEKEDPETSARHYILRRFKDVNRNRLSVYSFWVDLDMSDNQHLYAALKKTLHHIQTKKARNEVNASSSTLGTRKGGIAMSFSNLGSRNGTVGSRIGTAVSSKKGNSVDLKSPMMSEKSMLSSNASKGSNLMAMVN